MCALTDFTPIPKHQLNPDEPPHAVAAFVESTGEDDEYLALTARDEEDFIAISPAEARALRDGITRWLGE